MYRIFATFAKDHLLIGQRRGQVNKTGRVNQLGPQNHQHQPQAVAAQKWRATSKVLGHQRQQVHDFQVGLPHPFPGDENFQTGTQNDTTELASAPTRACPHSTRRRRWCSGGRRRAARAPCRPGSARWPGGATFWRGSRPPAPARTGARASPTSGSGRGSGATDRRRTRGAPPRALPRTAARWTWMGSRKNKPPRSIFLMTFSRHKNK